ncbi:MAG: ABC transporter ATP-binding protein [Planctomycetota bacterium]
MTAIRLNRVTFSYPKGEMVLNQITTDVPAGCTVLIGPNGAGKSTLLRLALGSIEPQEGTVFIDQRPPASYRGKELAKRVAYMGQTGEVAAAFTVLDVVRLAQHALPNVKGIVQEAMEACEVSDLRDRAYASLSVGQRQRVMLARLLTQVWTVGRPMVVLADEPTAALDPRHAMRVESILRRLSDERHAVVVAMHDLTAARRLGDRAIAIGNEGTLFREGLADEVISRPIMEDLFGVGFESVETADGRRSLLAKPL